MASVIRKQTKTGVRYDVQLSPGENKSRPKISLGKVTAKQADAAKRFCVIFYKFYMLTIEQSLDVVAVL